MIKQVILIRKDLNMRKSKIGAQASHVSMMFMTKNFEKLEHDSWLFIPSPEQKEWLEGSFTKIVLGVDSEQELDDYFLKAELAGLEVHMCVDNGKTEFGGVKTKTAIAIGPDSEEKINLITGHIKNNL
jgi:peptidyl-tRNA hydrolase, PTH2 family